MAELRRDRSADTADDEHDPEGVTLSTEWARLAGLNDAATRALAEIDEALARWDAGTYGICSDCGRSIPLERLRARPAATRCVACAEKARAVTLPCGTTSRARAAAAIDSTDAVPRCCAAARLPRRSV